MGAAVYELHEAVRPGVCQAPARIFIQRKTQLRKTECRKSRESKSRRRRTLRGPVQTPGRVYFFFFFWLKWSPTAPQTARRTSSQHGLCGGCREVCPAGRPLSQPAGARCPCASADRALLASSPRVFAGSSLLSFAYGKERQSEFVW